MFIDFLKTNNFLFLCRWYPPGHGDFYESFRNSSLLKLFLNQVFTIFLTLNI
jgi:UDP-N-acetylglucosamine pyrophosphorylase